MCTFVTSRQDDTVAEGKFKLYVQARVWGGANEPHLVRSCGLRSRSRIVYTAHGSCQVCRFLLGPFQLKTRCRHLVRHPSQPSRYLVSSVSLRSAVSCLRFATACLDSSPSCLPSAVHRRQHRRAPPLLSTTRRMTSVFLNLTALFPYQMGHPQGLTHFR